MHYEQLLERLLSVNIHSGIKLGLSNCLKLNEALDSPVNKFPAIHVAGTNGKGSVTTKMAAALQASGKRVGLYTSPHIACFRERIKINGIMISETLVQKHLLHIFSLIDTLNIPATFFEITTLMAFAYFAEENIDIGVIETGLGGRLDATNIVNPIQTIITSISLDHTDILGNTIEEITLEKAGIIKPKIPIFIGPRVPSGLIQEVADLHSSPCTIVAVSKFNNFQTENDAIATSALRNLEVPEYAIQQGLQTFPPCRVQTWLPNQLTHIFPNIPLPKALILDVAHNPDGIGRLMTILRQRFPEASIRFVVGLSKNKDIATCLSLISHAASHIHLIEANNYRAAPITMLLEALTAQGFSASAITCESSISLAIHNAVAIAGQQANEIVIVCGTFFIMAEARAALGIVEPQDASPLQ